MILAAVVAAGTVRVYGGRQELVNDWLPGLLQFLQWLIIPVVVAVIATAPEVEKGSGGSTCKDMDVLANKLIALMYVAALVGGLAWGIAAVRNDSRVLGPSLDSERLSPTGHALIAMFVPYIILVPLVWFGLCGLS